jgi:hypothetical protein
MDVPGGTQAGTYLQEKTLEAIVAFEERLVARLQRMDMEGLAAHEKARTDAAEPVVEDTEVIDQENWMTGWSERWTVGWCGESIAYTIHYEPSPGIDPTGISVDRHEPD